METHHLPLSNPFNAKLHKSASRHAQENLEAFKRNKAIPAKFDESLIVESGSQIVDFGKGFNIEHTLNAVKQTKKQNALTFQRQSTHINQQVVTTPDIIQSNSNVNNKNQSAKTIKK
jgi:hypothetical protein